MFDRNEGQEIGSELIAQPYIDSAFRMANEMRAPAPGLASFASKASLRSPKMVHCTGRHSTFYILFR